MVCRVIYSLIKIVLDSVPVDFTDTDLKCSELFNNKKTRMSLCDLYFNRKQQQMNSKTGEKNA